MVQQVEVLTTSWERGWGVDDGDKIKVSVSVFGKVREGLGIRQFIYSIQKLHRFGDGVLVVVPHDTGMVRAPI